jgi:hypothetical protein
MESRISGLKEFMTAWWRAARMSTAIRNRERRWRAFWWPSHGFGRARRARHVSET